ncbi:hypothetical protein [Sphingomicrobium lutaoense]|nr:hypothetical protein [Sphingomicrobium lutaoense]
MEQESALVAGKGSENAESVIRIEAEPSDACIAAALHRAFAEPEVDDREDPFAHLLEKLNACSG